MESNRVHLTYIGIATFVLFSSQLARAELEPIKEVRENLRGPLGAKVIEELLKPEYLPKIVQEYSYSHKELDWTIDSINENQELHVSYKPIKKTVDADHESQSSGSSWFGTGAWLSPIKNALNRAKDGIVGYLAQGDVTVRSSYVQVDCPAPYDKLGYQIKLDLVQAAPSMKAVAHGFAMEICYREDSTSPSELYTEIYVQTYADRGPLFPMRGIPQIESIMESETKAWASALINTFYTVQAKMVQESYDR